jgi:O-antigen/teichoic acid export membrane protein
MKTLKEKWDFVRKEGFVHIFGSRVANRVIRFATSVIIVRLLTKEIFGSFSYAMNILEFFLLLNGLGVVPAILQFCSEKKDVKDKLPYLKYGLKIGISFNIVIALLIILFTRFFDLPVRGSREILFYLGLIPVFVVIFEIMGSYLRANFKNREYSYLSVSNSLFYFLGTVIGGYLFKVYGIIAGRYLAFIFAILIGQKFLKEETKKIIKIESPLRDEKREFLKFSVIVTLTNSISQILYLLDIFLIGIILKEEKAVASYKTATLIPFALTFIPLSVMIFAYPYFAKNIKDKAKIKKYFYEMQKYLLIVNAGISLGLIIFAPLIITTLFGVQYLDSVVPFRILSLGYFFAGSFRIPAGNVIASVRKVKINLFNSVVSGVLNIGLDIVLICKFGSMGAAVATTTIFIISSMISNGYLFYYFKKR